MSGPNSQPACGLFFFQTLKVSFLVVFIATSVFKSQSLEPNASIAGYWGGQVKSRNNTQNRACPMICTYRDMMLVLELAMPGKLQ